MSDDTNICTCYSLIIRSILSATLFFFNDTATTEIYTLSLHDALPISKLVPRPDAVPLLLPGVDPQQRSSTIGIGPIAVQLAAVVVSSARFPDGATDNEEGAAASGGGFSSRLGTGWWTGRPADRVDEGRGSVTRGGEFDVARDPLNGRLVA